MLRYLVKFFKTERREDNGNYLYFKHWINAENESEMLWKIHDMENFYNTHGRPLNGTKIVLKTIKERKVKDD